MKIKKIIPFYLINLVFHKMAIQHERSLLMMMSKIHNNKKKSHQRQPTAISSYQLLPGNRSIQPTNCRQ